MFKTDIQVFLCLRVLLLRISPASLRGFWPAILTEMMDIFTREDHDPALIIAACKFLDLVMVLPATSELFNLYEWMFITEGLETLHEPVYLPFVENLAHKGPAAWWVGRRPCCDIPLSPRGRSPP